MYDVLILGYGPVGATFANLLGQMGHRVAVAEMHSEIFDKPRAVNLDQEALRLWQKIGLAKTISKGCAPHPGTDFLGADGKPIKSIYSAPPPFPLGWPANLMFVQPEAEKALRSRVNTLDTVDVFLEYTAIEFDQFDDFVSVTFQTQNGLKALSAKYLIGCDGANSPTRNWMGSTQTDLGFSEHYVVVDAWVERETSLPERTTQYCQPDAPTSYVVCSSNLRRWELKILPDEDVSTYNNLDRIKERLSPFVDVSALKFWRSSVYHFDARVCDQWRNINVFLAGDAAHTMPPFLGQGLNSGLRDAANLAWKLSYVLKGKAHEGILETYQQERRPHILELTEITKELGKIVGETDPLKAAKRDLRLRAEMEKNGPITVRQDLIPPLFEGFFEDCYFAGSLAPQPEVLYAGENSLLDDLLSGFSVIEKGERRDNLRITKDIEGFDPVTFFCSEKNNSITSVLEKYNIDALIVRPDGVIWWGGTHITPAIDRLRLQLETSTLVDNSS